VVRVTVARDLLQPVAEALQFGVEPPERQLPPERPVPVDESPGDLDRRQAVCLHGEAGRVPEIGSGPSRPEELDQAVVAAQRRAALVLGKAIAQRTGHIVGRVGQPHTQHRTGDHHLDADVQPCHPSSVSVQQPQHKHVSANYHAPIRR
jgi:hypothetical protein